MISAQSIGRRLRHRYHLFKSDTAYQKTINNLNEDVSGGRCCFLKKITAEAAGGGCCYEM
jgi:hypothetical protein